MPDDADPPEFLTPAELSARYQGMVPEKRLARWRTDGEGPPFVKSRPRQIRYRLQDVIAWERTRRIRTDGT